MATPWTITVLGQAPQRFEARQFIARRGVHAFGEVHHERHRRRRRAAPRRHVAARFAAGASPLLLEREGMRPAVAAQHADRHATAEVAIEGVVMRDQRHARQHVLERAGKQTLRQRCDRPARIAGSSFSRGRMSSTHCVALS